MYVFESVKCFVEFKKEFYCSERKIEVLSIRHSIVKGLFLLLMIEFKLDFILLLI